MNQTKNTRVVVAMSGGVDSSVAAALLQEQGFEVVGMMLRLWSETGAEMSNRCCTPEAMALARRVAAHLGIPFYAVDVRETFREQIVQYFIDGYTQGVTPNPCLMCNRQIRFGALLDQAIALGAEHLATGHYARLRRENGRSLLFRGLDRDKDQSYVLSVLDQAQLQRALFPIGELTKTEVREIARRRGLPTAERSDSQDLCFLAGGDYRDFLLRNAPEIEEPGEIIDPSGHALGTHQGLAFYTIGQRKGLGIAAPVPLYVIEKERSTNRLVVGPRESLGKNTLIADRANWLVEIPAGERLHCAVQTRYTARETPAEVIPGDGGTFMVEFNEPVRDITPGQAAVVYAADQVVGSGIITCAVRNTR